MLSVKLFRKLNSYKEYADSSRKSCYYYWTIFSVFSHHRYKQYHLLY